MIADAVGPFAVALCLLIGIFFTLVAAIGLLKLDNAMSRLHAPTKAGTLGIGAFLLASMIQSFMLGEGSFNEMLIIAFLFVTAPVSAHFIAKVNIHKQACVSPPPPPKDDTWSTLDVPAEDLEIEAPIDETALKTP